MKIGATFQKRRQRYEGVWFRDNVNRFGRKTSLVILESRCAQCGALFHFMATGTMRGAAALTDAANAISGRGGQFTGVPPRHWNPRRWKQHA